MEDLESEMSESSVLGFISDVFIEDFVSFIDRNMHEHPGRTAIKFNISDSAQKYKISMRSLEKGFTMNDEMALYLNSHQHIDVNVLTV